MRVREHCIRDIAGFTRAPRQHIVDCFGTPKAVGGLGLEVGSKRWRRVEEQEDEPAPFETRRVSRTDPERVPGAVRKAATDSIRSHGGLFRRLDFARAAADGMLASVQGQSWDAAENTLSTIKPVEQSFHAARMLGGKTVDFTAPRSAVDPLFLAPMLRVALKLGWHFIEKLIDVTDRNRCWLRYKAWPRSVWFDWMVGRIGPKAHDAWGMGSVVASALKDDLGREMLVPAGRMTRDGITQGMLWSELASRSLRLSEKMWMGA